MPWLLLLLACPRHDPGVDSESGTTPAETWVDPAIAVAAVDAVQVGPDVAFTFQAPPGVTRITHAAISWGAGTTTVDVGLDDGTAVVLLQIPMPCDLLGTDAEIIIVADGSRWDIIVPLEGSVAPAGFLAVNPHSGLGAVCAETAVLDAVGAAYELRAASVFVTADDGYTGTSFSSHVVLYLDGRYDLVWRESPHDLMVVAVEAP